MSFGASPSDIIIVVKFCKSLYRKCRTAGGEYDEISREVRNLHTVLRHLNYEIAAPDSALNKDGGFWEKQLGPIIEGCDNTLRQLDGTSGGSVLTHYDDDDREVWRQFRRELVAEGFSSDVLQQHKDVLRAYIREIDTK
ncbi:hypothetical protein BJ878DRAFT_403372, partial [Calycina marina]